MRYLDQTVTDAGGVAFRYGGFYGAANDGLVEPVRKRQFPIVGDGGGVSSFIHLDDAAAATVLALEHDGPAIYNIVDDEPAPVREWLPVLAQALGAKPPRRVPRWLARLLAGEAPVMIGTEARGASNAKAKRELGWTLRYPSWRQGFVEVYGSRPRRRPCGRRRSGREPSSASQPGPWARLVSNQRPLACEARFGQQRRRAAASDERLETTTLAEDGRRRVSRGAERAPAERRRSGGVA